MKIRLTKSNAAILRRFASPPVGCWSFAASLAGSYLPTRRLSGASSFGARSCHVIFSGGFWEDGVKNDATAVSISRMSAYPYGLQSHWRNARVVLDWSLRRKGGGETGALWSSFLFGGIGGLAIVTRYLRRIRFSRISSARQIVFVSRSVVVRRKSR